MGCNLRTVVRPTKMDNDDTKIFRSLGDRGKNGLSYQQWEPIVSRGVLVILRKPWLIVIFNVYQLKNYGCYSGMNFAPFRDIV